LAKFSGTASRGDFPLLIPPYAKAERALPGAPAAVAVLGINIDTIPLSLVAASGRSAGAAAILFGACP
jgi:hypothetical protein